MNIPNLDRRPKIWTDNELADQAKQSIDAFVQRRLEEPRERYVEHLAERQAHLLSLFRALAGLDRSNPEPEAVRRMLLQDETRDAFRYVAGPPVSEDDLGVLVTRSTNRLTKKRLRNDDALVIAILKLVCGMSDPVRFPWIDDGRTPALRELKHAIRATAALHATQAIQTERRGFGRKVEMVLRDRLIALGYEKVATPNKGKITAPLHWPKEKTFYGECTVYGRKADILVGTTDGRIVAIEAKDSASALNSIKRVLNDTAAKASHWTSKAGEEVIPVALLSGVFAVENLKAAQAKGLYLVWTHELDSFVEWLSAQ